MNKITVPLSILLVLMTTGCSPFPTVEGATEPLPSKRAEAAPASHDEKSTILVEEKSPIRQRLVIESPQLKEVSSSFSAPASVEVDPARFAQVYPPLSGRILHLNARLGDSVQEGQALIVMDSPDFNEAQGDSLRSRSALELARKNLARATCLYEHGVAARKEIDQAQSDHDVAQSEYERAQTRLRLYTQNTEQRLGEPISVKAPISGRIVELSVTKGEFRNDAATPMMTVADLSTVWITADVQEKDVRHVYPNEDVTVVLTAYPEDTFHGSVLFVGDVLNTETRCVKVRIAAPNPEGRLKPGMFATATFTGKPNNVVTVPTTAIFQIDGVSQVFVETSPWRFARQEVTVGAQCGDRTVVLAGLSTENRVVTKEGSLIR